MLLLVKKKLMSNIQSKYIVAVPDSIKVFYSKRKKIIIFKGPLCKKSLKLKVELLIPKTKQIIKISTTFISSASSNNSKKKAKIIQGTTTSLIKQLLIESSTIFYKKLKIVGVGYRAFDVDRFENKLLLFKLGYSHPLYFKTPQNLNTLCLKFTKLFIYGNSYSYITQIASSIRVKKMPEPYKGKGILYETENITLKEGKKN